MGLVIVLLSLLAVKVVKAPVEAVVAPISVPSILPPLISTVLAVNKPLAVSVPEISNVAAGLVVPMPTFPPCIILIYSLLSIPMANLFAVLLSICCVYHSVRLPPIYLIPDIKPP